MSLYNISNASYGLWICKYELCGNKITTILWARTDFTSWKRPCSYVILIERILIQVITLNDIEIRLHTSQGYLRPWSLFKDTILYLLSSNTLLSIYFCWVRDSEGEFQALWLVAPVVFGARFVFCINHFVMFISSAAIQISNFIRRWLHTFVRHPVVSGTRVWYWWKRNVLPGQSSTFVNKIALYRYQ